MSVSAGFIAESTANVALAYPSRTGNYDILVSQEPFFALKRHKLGFVDSSASSVINILKTGRWIF